MNDPAADLEGRGQLSAVDGQLLIDETDALDLFERGQPLVHPFHPLPALVLLLLCSVTYFAVFLGYGTQLVAMMLFFAVASIWFHFHRYRYVRRGDQFTMQWPRPQGY